MQLYIIYLKESIVLFSWSRLIWDLESNKTCNIYIYTRTQILKYIEILVFIGVGGANKPL